jgi:undecaprenyl pyrophosphate phosphatase UppP
MSTTNGLLETNKVKYLDLTHKLNDYNEIYSVNTYLKGNNTVELDRLNAIDNALRAKLMKSKQEYMLREHDIRQNRFRTNVIYFTALVVSVIIMIVALFMLDRINQYLAVGLAVGFLLLYFIIMLFVMKAQADRKKYSYDQYYWDGASAAK